MSRGSFAVCFWLLLAVLAEGRPSASRNITHMRMAHHCEALNKELSIPGTSKNKDTSTFWMGFWDPTWSCPLEQKVGHRPRGDGGKWVCDVQHLYHKNCLIYSIGSLGEYFFETDTSAQFQCEIHVFDPFNYGYIPDPAKTNIHVHKWGVAPYSHELSLNGNLITMKSMQDIILSLGHQNREIDILKIDVEGCEFGIMDNRTMWNDLKAIGTSFSQVLIEVHFLGISKKNYKFRPESITYTGQQIDGLMRELVAQGYAMFHKELNALGQGRCTEYSFALLNIDCANLDRSGPSKFLQYPQ